MPDTTHVRTEAADTPAQAGGQLFEVRGQADLMRETVPAQKPPARLGSVVRVSFGIIWLIDAYFKWQPAFQHGISDVMRDGAKNQPTWLMPWFHFHLSLVAANPAAWALGSAVIETVIGILLILGLARKLTYVAGAIWSLLIWATAEGFGHPNPGMPWTDIGTAILYTFVFLMLLAFDAEAGRAQTGTRPYSFDAVLERRLPGWRHIAEMRR